MIKEIQARPVRLTSSGTVIGRDTRLSGVSVQSATVDLVINLRNGNASSEILWTIESDAGAGSHYEAYEPPIRFTNGIYAEFSHALENQSANFLVVEPVPTA